MLGLCFVVWFVLQRTTTGFEIRMVGANPHAARYAGISVNRVIVLVMAAVRAPSPGSPARARSPGTSGFLSPGVFVADRLRLDRDRPARRANPFAIIPAAILWGSMLVGRAAHAAGDRPVDRHHPHRAGARAALRRRRRDRAHDLPHPARRRARCARGGRNSARAGGSGMTRPRSADAARGRSRASGGSRPSGCSTASLGVLLVGLRRAQPRTRRQGVHVRATARTRRRFSFDPRTMVVAIGIFFVLDRGRRRARPALRAVHASRPARLDAAVRAARRHRSRSRCPTRRTRTSSS